MKMSEKKILFLTRFIVESDAIENIEADSELVSTQLKEKINNGHVGAMMLLEASSKKKSEFIAKNPICKVQGLITEEQHTKPGGPKLRPEYIGKYRLVNVSVGKNLPPHYSLVPFLMDSWIYHVVNWQKVCSQYLSDLNLRHIATFHYEYERIHPFADGNGRSGRALVYYLMRYCGIKPFVFTSDDKHETYYRCFNNPEEMRKYFEARTIQ